MSKEWLVYAWPVVQTFITGVVFMLVLEWGREKLKERKAAREAKAKVAADAVASQQTIAAEIPSTVWAWLRNEHEDNLKLRANELSLTERAINAEATVKALQYKVDVEMHTNLVLTREKAELEREKIELEVRLVQLEAQLAVSGES